MALQHPLKSGSVTKNAAVFSSNALHRRQPFPYAPERPTTDKVRVARDPGVTLCAVICPTSRLLGQVDTLGGSMSDSAIMRKSRYPVLANERDIFGGLLTTLGSPHDAM